MAETQSDCPAISGAPWRLRPAVASDFDSLWALDQVCFAPELAYSRREMRELMSMRNAATWLAESQPETATGEPAAKPAPLGFIVLHAAGTTGHVITLDVAPQSRRQGLGAALLAIGELYSRRRGARRMRLETAVNNDTALRFYKRQGYQITNRLNGYYTRELDAWQLEKPLEIGAK